MLRTYKYLLRPTPEQAEKLDFLLAQARRVYNAALEQRITAYQEAGVNSRPMYTSDSRIDGYHQKECGGG